MDYYSEAGEPIGFNTALVAQIAKRLGMNVEFISVDSGARAVALASDRCDVVFWCEGADFNNWEGASVEDQPEHTIITAPYLSNNLKYIMLASSLQE